MSDSIDKKQKLLLERIASNRELFVKCIRIIQPEFFEKPLDRVASFIKEYFVQYNDIAAFDVIEAETDVDLTGRQLDAQDFDYVCNELEQFCREQAMMSAVLQGVDCIESGDLGSIEGLVRDALRVKLDNTLGTELFDDPEERIKQMDIEKDHRKIGLDCFDEILQNIGRGELGIICAVSGGGKSLALGNIGWRLAKQQLNVLYITLELDEGLYSKRLDSIVTNTEIAQHLENAAIIAELLGKQKDNMGSMLIKRMRNGTTCSDIRSFVMEYQIQRGYTPDVIMVDYLAGMGVDGVKTMIGTNKFDIDKEKSEGLREIMDEFNAYGFTAAQINRDGQDVYSGILPSHIQGGMSMIQTSDWTVAMLQNQEDIDNNQFKTLEMKLRNSAKQGIMRTGYINPKTLRFDNNPGMQSTNGVNKRKLGGNGGKPAANKTHAPAKDDQAAKTKVKNAMNKLKR